jgi:TPR repeat protein
MENDSELRQAEFILNALVWCSDENQYDSLLSMAKKILEPYLRVAHPRALWLKSGMPNIGEDSTLSEQEFDSKHLELLRLAAEGGCREAQYSHGCNLYDEGKISEAIDFYFQSAQEDYAPAQWCYGLDVLHGNGIEKNEIVGLGYIRMAAEQRYQYAVEFMIDSYTNGKYGFKGEEELQRWQRILPHCEHRY